MTRWTCEACGSESMDLTPEDLIASGWTRIIARRAPDYYFCPGHGAKEIVDYVVRHHRSPGRPRGRDPARQVEAGGETGIEDPPGDRPDPDPYIPSRIRDGARPSVANCFGCLDLCAATPRLGGRRRRICLVAQQKPQHCKTCPKMSKERS